MPWKGKQAQAIFLDQKRRHGEAAAHRFMHEHGNRSEAVRSELRKRRKKKRPD